MCGASFEFKAVIGGDFADELFVSALSLRDVLKLECTSRSAQQSLLSGSSWVMSACHELLPRFRVTGPARMFRGACKEDIRQLLATLRGVSTTSPATLISLGSLSQSLALAAATRRAETRACRHLEMGGTFSQVVVCNFCFPSAAAALAETSARSLDMHASSRIIINNIVQGNQSQAWQFKLAMQGGKMLVGARRRDAPIDPLADPVAAADAQLPSLLVDVHSVCDEFSIRLFDAGMQADASWVSAMGLCSMSGSRAAAIQALTRGITCVLCIRDTRTSERPSESKSGLHTMNLDAPRRSSS
mmetsp:Transcript_8902/g.22896  ORF Transcript_8902/g.22896 Transcript_8902/m.22896 type:complete len:302 (-) Transcript_8902:84-989(-)